MNQHIGVAIAGCGNIAGPYAADMPNYPELELIGAADLDPERAAALAAQHGIRAYTDLDALLADPAVHLVVNLTTFQAHYEVIERCLRAGKHVYSEKPLAMTYDEGRRLVALAEQLGLRLGCSPFTLMGEAQQTAWKLIRDGRLGRVRVVYAEANQGRIETWHPAPVPFYDIGVIYDVGVYPLTLLVAMLGPARRVSAYGAVVLSERTTTAGEAYTVTTPDWVVATLELEGGVRVRLTATFYVTNRSKQSGIEFHGDRGSLYLESTYLFDAAVEFSPYGEAYEPQPLVRAGRSGVPWAAGVHETATALIAGRPHRFSGEMAAHVLEIMEAVRTAYTTGESVPVHSTFTPPPPMAWAG